MSEGRLELKVQLFAKAKELAGGRDFLLCSLAASDASISCQEFLDRYVYTVSPASTVCKNSPCLAASTLCTLWPCANILLQLCLVPFLSAKMKRALSTLVTPWPLKKLIAALCLCYPCSAYTHVVLCAHDQDVTCIALL